MFFPKFYLKKLALLCSYDIIISSSELQCSPVFIYVTLAQKFNLKNIKTCAVHRLSRGGFKIASLAIARNKSHLLWWPIVATYRFTFTSNAYSSTMTIIN